MRINARLKNLEKHASKRATCPDCGFPLDGSIPENVKFECNRPEVGNFKEPPKPVDTSKDHCKTCGMQLVWRITVDPPRASWRDGLSTG